MIGKSCAIFPAIVTLAQYKWEMGSTTSPVILSGAVLDAVYLYNKYGAPLDYEVWQSLRSLLGWLSRNWHQPDAGMWDVRDSREHFVSSKVLSWVALDRGIRLALTKGDYQPTKKSGSTSEMPSTKR